MIDKSKKPKAIKGEILGPDEELPKPLANQSSETRPGLFGMARTFVQKKDIEGKTKLVRAQADLTAAYAEGTASQYEFEMGLKKLETIPEEGTRIVEKAKHDRQEEELRGDSLERNAVEEQTRRLEAKRLQEEERSRATHAEQKTRMDKMRLDLEEAQLKQNLDQITRPPEEEPDPLKEISKLKELREKILRDVEKKRGSGGLSREDEEDAGEKLERIQKRTDELTRTL